MIETSFYLTIVDTFRGSVEFFANSLEWFTQPLTYLGGVAITPLLLITPIGLIAFIGVALVRWLI